MKISVIFRNETPIHSSAPTKSTIDANGTIGVPNAMPLTRMRTMRVPAPGMDGSVSIRPLPCVPSNTMRNLLRRSALDTVFNQLRGKATLDVGAYAAACSGNASGNPEGVAASFDETNAVRKHVFLGLFGGGPRMMKGRLSVDTMYPIVPDAARIIGDGFEDRMISGQILDVVWQRRVDPVEKLAFEAPEELITNAHSAITAWSIKNQENKAKSAGKGKAAESEGAGANERGLNAFNAQEVVIPGLDWLWGVRLENPSKAQAGLVLKAISDIAQRGMQVAGGNAKDYGKVNIQEVLVDGQSVWDGQSYTASMETYLDALAESLDEITADDFANFVKPSKEDKDE